MGGKLITGAGLAVAAIAILAVLAGCGGGSSSSSSGSTAAGEAKSGEGGGEVTGGDLSKSEFVKRANAICEEGKKQSLEAMSKYVKEQGGAQANPKALVEAVKAVFLPELKTQIAEIRALGAPKGDEATVGEFLTAMEKGLEKAEAPASSSNGAFAQSFKQSAKLAHEYGLDGCAYG